MNRAPILFRCDGSPANWEGFYQCSLIAAAMQRRRRPCHFRSVLEPALSLAQTLRKGGNDWHPADDTLATSVDLEHTLRLVRKLEPAAVVVAGDNINTDYLSALKETGTLVVALDRAASLHFPGRLVINPFLGPDVSSYDFAPRTQLLLGARYALVRPAIRRMRPLRSQDPISVLRALLALGDDDTAQQTVERCKQLLATPRLERVDVAVRPNHPQLAELQAMAEAEPRLEIVTEPNEIGLRVPRCHLAVTTGDSWSLEFACVGLPQLMLLNDERYLTNAQRLEEEGAAAIIGEGSAVSASQFKQAVQGLLNDQPERQNMSRCGRQLIDGRGPDRVINAFEVLLHPAVQPTTLRIAA